MGGPSKTKPTGEKGGKPKGDPEKPRPDDDTATRRGLEKQEKSANELANEGYVVEHNKTKLPNGKKPDYII